MKQQEAIYSSKQGVGCGMKPTYTDKEAVLNFIKDNPDTNGIGIIFWVIRNKLFPTILEDLFKL